MPPTVDPDTEQVLALFRQGQLTEPALRQALEQRRPAAARQDLLYLQASSTALSSSLLGLSLVRAGELVEVPVDEWPYTSVLGALRDGWRIIKFPELALIMVDGRTLGLGCEFVLEQWS